MSLNTVSLRERIALCDDFSAEERLFILDRVTADTTPREDIVTVDASHLVDGEPFAKPREPLRPASEFYDPNSVMPDNEQDTNEVESLAGEIALILRGRRPWVVGAALADLLATWLASHFDTAGRKQTDRLRDGLLTSHIAAVRRMIPLNEKIASENRRRSAH